MALASANAKQFIGSPTVLLLRCDGDRDADRRRDTLSGYLLDPLHRRLSSASHIAKLGRGSSWSYDKTMPNWSPTGPAAHWRDRRYLANYSLLVEGKTIIGR